jgi:acetylornithine deacetylase
MTDPAGGRDPVDSFDPREADGFAPAEFCEQAVAVPSHESVDAMRDRLCAELRAHGVDPTVDDAGNVIATRGPDGEADADASDAPHYLLNTHIDTVPPHVPGGRDGDVLHGRGACDAKGPLAALLGAFLAVNPGGGRVTLAVTPDEETLSTGAHHLVQRGVFADVDGVVVGEPTGMDVCHAARGRFEGTVRITGEAAHAADPGAGRNAVRAAAPVLQALDTFDDEAGPGEHDALGAPTLVATGIRGGEATNQVPASCEVTFDRRSVPPETADGFRASLEDHVAPWVTPTFDCTVALTERETPFLEAFATDAADPLVGALADASGGAVRPFGAATEASYFAAHAPTVVFGPGDLVDDDGPVAHGEREYVRLPDVDRAAAAVRDALAALSRGD